jgi:hypothetical protein
MQSPSFKTAICSDYEKLLFACQKALEVWRERREEVVTNGFACKETANELLRLQADYARAYSRLEGHDDRCPLCRFVSKIGGRNYSSISTAALEKKSIA